jgi:acyl-CoA thioesterase
MSFDTDTAIRPVETGAYAFDVPAHWRIGGGATNGGYLAAVVTRAMIEAVADPGRLPRSLTIHYLAACAPGPAAVSVSIERQGRSLTTLSARVTQSDVTVALALAAFARPRPGLEFQREPMPEAPPPDELPALVPPPGRPTFPSNWDYRPCVGGLPFSRAPEPVSGGWIRPREPRVLDAPLLAAMADSWFPPVLLLFESPRGVVPTMDLTVHFRSDLPLVGADPEDFSFAVFSSRVAAGGYWDSDGVIWSQEGRVLAQARQLAVFNLTTE